VRAAGAVSAEGGVARRASPHPAAPRAAQASAARSRRFGGRRERITALL
jgi:hypothetical protein